MKRTFGVLISMSGFDYIYSNNKNMFDLCFFFVMKHERFVLVLYKETICVRILLIQHPFLLNELQIRFLLQNTKQNEKIMKRLIIVPN